MPRPIYRNPILGNVLKWTVVVAALAYLIGTGKLSLGQLRIQSASWPVMALGVGVLVLSLLTGPIRYYLLLWALNLRLRIREVYRISFIAYFFNTFLIGGVGGDVVRVAYVGKQTGTHSAAVASVLIDRILGMLSVFCLGGAVLVVNFPTVLNNQALQQSAVIVLTVLLGVGVCSLVSIVALTKGRKTALLGALLPVAIGSGIAVALLAREPWALLHSDDASALLRGRAIAALIVIVNSALLAIMLVPSLQANRTLGRFLIDRVPFGSSIVRMLEAIYLFRNRVGVLTLSLALSLLIQALTLVSIFLFGRALLPHSGLELSHVFFAAPLAFLANALPLPGGGLGVGEAVFDQLLRQCQTSTGEAVTGGAAMLLLWRFWVILLGLIGLPLYLRRKREISREVPGLHSESDAPDPPPKDPTQ